MGALCILGILLFATPIMAQTQTANGSFADNSDNEDGFKVERQRAGDAYAVVQTLPANVAAFSDTVANPAPGNITYCWRIVAFNAAGDAGPSNEACLTTPQVLTVPAGASNLVIQFVIK